jgi:hypothetical protein
LILIGEIIASAAKHSIGFPSMVEEPVAKKLTELADRLRKCKSDHRINRSCSR